MPKLLNETVEMVLGLLDKNGCLAPFCKALTINRELLMIIMANFHEGTGPILLDELKNGIQSTWIELKRRIIAGEISEFAFCSDTEIKLAKALRVPFSVLFP